MKKMSILFLCLLAMKLTSASSADSVLLLNLPDSVKAVAVLANVKVTAINSKKELFAGIQTDVVKLRLESEKQKHSVVFEFPENSEVVATGIDIDATEKGEMEWSYHWNTNENYKLMIATASDSAENFSLYSGYIFLPKEAKWKLIGTCKIAGRWNTIQQPSATYSSGRKMPLTVEFGAAWCQRQNGSWKNMLGNDTTTPVINFTAHLDSLAQATLEKKQIEEAIALGKTDAKNNKDGVYYANMKEGTGKAVAVTDTVSVFYKGYVFADGKVFDQTRESPATFPLNRLIKGWQYGLPQCKTGGKIKLVIPSGLAYSIRTRAAKIPPNSILVFEVEILDSKPAK